MIFKKSILVLRTVDSGFQGLDSGFPCAGFRIPEAKISWIPDSLTWGDSVLCKFAKRFDDTMVFSKLLELAIRFEIFPVFASIIVYKILPTDGLLLYFPYILYE